MAFELDRIAGTRIVRARMSLLFSLRDASAMTRAYADLVTELRYDADTFDLLVDLTGAPIQSADVVVALSAILRAGRYRPANAAFVHGNAPIALQARRVAAELKGRSFATMPEAFDWLAVRAAPAHA